MRGHEYIREAVRTYLEATLPSRLAAHLAANELTSPATDGINFVLADGLQDITRFPVVVVRSTDAGNDQWTGDGTWSIIYDVEIIAACDHRVHGGYESASKDRDRLLLAVRECMYAATSLTEDIDILPGKRPEQTGAAMETRAGVPLAAGTLKLRARVLESLTDLNPPEDIDVVDLTATGYDAGQTLP